MGERLRRLLAARTFALCHPFQAVVQRQEIGVAEEGSRQRQGVRQAKRTMARAQLSGTPGDRTVDRDHRGADGVEELIDLGIGFALEGAHQHFRVDAGAEDQRTAGRKHGSKRVRGALVLIVARVQERDHEIGVERYWRHSSRNSSRWRGGYVPAGRLPA